MLGTYVELAARRSIRILSSEQLRFDSVLSLSESQVCQGPDNLDLTHYSKVQAGLVLRMVGRFRGGF